MGSEVNTAVLCFLRCEECMFRRTVRLESKRVGHLTDRIILRLDCMHDECYSLVFQEGLLHII